MKNKPRLAIVLEGGVIQSIIADEEACCEVRVIDYDEPSGPRTVEIQQGGGKTAPVLVYTVIPRKSLLPLNDIFKKGESK